MLTSVSVAGPQTANTGEQFYIYVWTSGMTVSGDYVVDLGDGTSGDFAPSTESRVTAIPITYSAEDTPGNYTIQVTAHSTAGGCFTQTYGMDDVGNYPAGNGGPSVYMPSGATSASAKSVVVDGGTGYTYVAESYTSSSGTVMALTRLTSSDLPDTSWGTLVSGSTYTGTLLVPSFGGGDDVPEAAAVLDRSELPDEVAMAGSSANGMAVAIIDVGGTGSVAGTSGYDSQTMPSGYAYAVMFDTSNDVIAAGTNEGGNEMVAVALYGVTSGSVTAGELDTTFDDGTGVSEFGFGGTTHTQANAIMQIPADGDLVLGGWCQAGCGACSTQCNMVLVALQDTSTIPSQRGLLDTGFGGGGTGYCIAENVGTAACCGGANFNCCTSYPGCGVPSNDSVLSLAFDDDLNDDYGEIVAIGETNYSGSEQFALWAVSDAGYTYDAFGGHDIGLDVPNVDATPAGGIVDDVSESSPTDGDIYLVGTQNGNLVVARYDPYLYPNASGDYYWGLDTSFGTGQAASSEAQGYFTQNVGTASGSSGSVTGVSIAQQNDYSVIAVGNTSGSDFGAGVVAVRYYVSSPLELQEGDGDEVMTSAAAVQAASQSASPFSSGPALTADTPSTDNDLSPPDSSSDPNNLHHRRSGRPPISLGSSPPAASTTLVTTSSA